MDLSFPLEILYYKVRVELYKCLGTKHTELRATNACREIVFQANDFQKQIFCYELFLALKCVERNLHLPDRIVDNRNEQALCMRAKRDVLLQLFLSHV